MLNLINYAFIFFASAQMVSQQINDSTQTIETDSLLLQKIHHYLQRSTVYSTSQIDSSFIFTKKAEELAARIKNDSILSRIRFHKAGLYILSEKFSNAEKLLMENLEIPNIDLNTLGMTYHNLGTLFNFQEKFEKATVNYIKASEIAELQNDSTLLSMVYSNIGVIHTRLKDFPKAKTYLNKALNFVGGNEILKLQIIANVSESYYDTNELDKAISAAHEAEELAKKHNTKSFLAPIYSNLCKFYLEKEELNTSIKYGKDALALGQEINQNTADILNNLAHAYMKKGDNEIALVYLEKALPLSIGELKSKVYRNLALTNEKAGKYKKALANANNFIWINDSINTHKQLVKVNELTEKYKSEKKQQQLDLLNTKNELNQTKIANQSYYIWALALFSLLAVLVGFLLYRNQKTNQSLKTATIQHRLLQAQLNPHFIFNALNSIQAFGYANKSEKLSDYVDSFSKLMRSILESSDQDFISVKEDSRTLKEYLYLQKLSTENTFETSIVIDVDVDPQILIPPMFTQPFVENSVLHGVKNRKDGFIEVVYSEETNGLLVTIKDNGKGEIMGSVSDNKLHRSMGMKIIKDRVANLKKTNKYKCSIKVDSGDTGTTVQLTFPIRHNKIV